MKIAFLYDAVYPWVKGGGEKRVWEISRRLAKKGHEVHIFGMKYWNGKDVFIKNGVYLHGICEPKDLYVEGEGRRAITEAIYFAWKLLSSLKCDFDVLDCLEFPYFSCFSAKLHSIFKKTPLIITWLEVWDDYWYEYLGKKGIFGKATERLTLKLPDRIITISEKVKNDLISAGVNYEKIRVIPDGIDFKAIQKITPSTKRYDILYAGRLIKHKNVNILIKAVDIVKKEMPDIKCGIIGDGPEKENLINVVKDLNIEGNIEFFGFLEQDEDVISYMKSSSVFVLPSTREGAGLVTLEANACGLPVITVNHEKNAAVEVVINNENGFLSELSEGDIAKKMLVALDKKEDMERKCIDFSRRYDWDRMAGLTESAYEELLR